MSKGMPGGVKESMTATTSVEPMRELCGAGELARWGRALEQGMTKYSIYG